MEEKKSKSTGRKIVGGVLKGLGGIAFISLVGYVGNEVRKEYDSTVDENNRLRDFISSHDFYEKQQTSFRANTYKEAPKKEETTNEEKFDTKNPIYKQSLTTMLKMGLNADGTTKSKPAIVRLEDEVSEDGFIVEVREDVASGMKVYKQTSRKAEDAKDVKKA